jgi:formyl-CoA transferase
VKDVAEDPQVQARGMLHKATTADGLDVIVPGIVPILSENPGAVRARAPRLGENTQLVLGEAGFSDAELAALRAKGIIN